VLSPWAALPSLYPTTQAPVMLSAFGLLFPQDCGAIQPHSLPSAASAQLPAAPLSQMTPGVAPCFVLLEITMLPPYILWFSSPL
jgi:hypothetical protein